MATQFPRLVLVGIVSKFACFIEEDGKWLLFYSRQLRNAARVAAVVSFSCFFDGIDDGDDDDDDNGRV